MPRKQSTYLADLLNDDEGQETDRPAAERGRPSTLLQRESALARVQSGEVRQVTQFLLDPARVRIWPGNARRYQQLTEANCRDLIDSFLAEGGQKVPAIVRRVTDDDDHDYEVIAGTRRHWAISWLRAHSYPDMQFVAQVATLDNEAAFRLADIENRARRDISDIERARNYASALEQYYGGKQRRMAERLHVSESWLSKMLQVARIPDDFLDAFGSWDEIPLKPAYALVRALDDPSAASRMAEEAQRLSTLQAEARAQGTPTLPAAEVLRRLMAAAHPRKDRDGQASDALTFASRSGRPALTVQSVGRQGATIRLHARSGAGHEELVSAFRDILAALDAAGHALT